jgi:hypothetical protein
MLRCDIREQQIEAGEASDVGTVVQAKQACHTDALVQGWTILRCDIRGSSSWSWRSQRCGHRSAR